MVLPAAAATVDFSTFSPGNRGPALSIPNGVLAQINGGSVVVYGPSNPTPGVCSRPGASGCGGGLMVIFFGPVTDLSFDFSPRADAAPVNVTLYSDGTELARLPARGGTFTVPDGLPPVTGARLGFTGASGSGAVLEGLSFVPTGPVPQVGAAAQPAPGDTGGGRPDQPHTLDFADPVQLAGAPTAFDIDGAIVTLTDGDEIFIYDPNAFGQIPGTGGFCALDQGFRCLGDAMIVFDTLVRDLSFETFFFGVGDEALVTLFSGDQVLDRRRLTSAGEVTFFGFSAISHLMIEDRSQFGSKGIAYGNFRYAIDILPEIPLPAPALGLAAGLAMIGGLSAFRRRKTRE